MKRVDLELEHIFKGKFVGRHRLRAGRRTWVLGRSKEADIRLLGDDVSVIHSYIECQDGTWIVSDAGSREGTWVDKKAVTMQAVTGVTTITLGGHTLKVTPHTIEKEFFKAEELSDVGSGQKLYHQAVVLKGDRVVDTYLLKTEEAFVWSHAGRTETLSAPKPGEMKETTFGDYRVIQRFVKSDVMKSHGGDWKSFVRDPEMRAPMAVALIFILLLVTLIVAIPKRPDQAMNEIKPDNKYTRMVFDADLMRKKRDQAKEARKALLAKSPVAKSQPNPTPPAQAAKAAPNKVVKNLKLDSLNALLGKITKRAVANAPQIAGYGRNPDSIDSGHTTTVAAVGSLQGIATQVGTATGTFKIGAVGTAGVGGGHGVAGASGLANGGVGTGTVGILDEETEIEGGLDREVIAKVINGYLGEIRYCYERQLSAEPDIYGKVQVKFTIDGAGAVEEQHVGNTTLKSAMVEGCILRRLARWKFPKPKGGTHVLVTYPFMFKSTN